MAKERLCNSCIHNNNGWCKAKKTNKDLRNLKECELREELKKQQQFKIGSKFVVTEDFDIKGMLSEETITVKKGDEAFIDARGFAHWVKGNARGKIQKFKDVELKGYDTENMAKMIFNRLDYCFQISELLDDIEVEMEDAINEIEDALTDIF